jgi:Lon protease-like protein
MSRYLPIFPLGTAVLPTQVLPLHVFEPRYRALMEVLTDPVASGELGVVLIERGSEVGGGDVRVETGTLVHLIEAEQLPDGRWLAVFAGSHRFRVSRWLRDDPYPRAEVEEVADAPWDSGDGDAFAAAELAVREALRLAGELGDPAIRPGFVLSANPALAAWELCAIAPLGPLDRQRLLEAPTHLARLNLLASQANELAKVLAFRLEGR